MNGADKSMLPLGGKPLLQHVIARAAPQVDELLLSANGDPARFTAFGRTVIADHEAGYFGPIAGILSGFKWAKQNRAGAKWLISFACDCPFLPRDLVVRLLDGAEQADVPVAVAGSGRRHHPVFTAWSMSLPLSWAEILHVRALRAADHLIEMFPNTRVEFPDIPIDPFFNINTPDDLARAEVLVAEYAGV